MAEVVEGRLNKGSSEKIDATVVVQADGISAHREAVVLADPIIKDARVQLEPFLEAGKTRYAAPTTSAEARGLSELMVQLVKEQRLTNLFLSRLAGESLTLDDLEDF